MPPHSATLSSAVHVERALPPPPNYILPFPPPPPPLGPNPERNPGSTLKIGLETDDTLPKVLLKPFSGHIGGVRACSILLEPKLSHKKWIQGLQLLFEVLKDLPHSAPS